MDISAHKEKGEITVNRLPVNKLFESNVRGKLQAKLRNNDTEAYTDEEDGAKRYIIDLFYLPERNNSNAIEDVMFYLDDTYSDPVRLAERNRDGSFEATIQSSGDFVITVEVIAGGRSFRQQMWLSDMLESGYADTIPSPAVVQAIRELRDN